MNIREQFKMWKIAKNMPIVIFKYEKPYIRLFTNWVWNPRKGYFGFLAID